MLQSAWLVFYTSLIVITDKPPVSKSLSHQTQCQSYSFLDQSLNKHYIFTAYTVIWYFEIPFTNYYLYKNTDLQNNVLIN